MHKWSVLTSQMISKAKLVGSAGIRSNPCGWPTSRSVHANHVHVSMSNASTIDRTTWQPTLHKLGAPWKDTFRNSPATYTWMTTGGIVQKWNCDVAGSGDNDRSTKYSKSLYVKGVARHVQMETQCSHVLTAEKHWDVLLQANAFNLSIAPKQTNCKGVQGQTGWKTANAMKRSMVHCFTVFWNSRLCQKGTFPFQSMHRPRATSVQKTKPRRIIPMGGNSNVIALNHAVQSVRKSAVGVRPGLISSETIRRHPTLRQQMRCHHWLGFVTNAISKICKIFEAQKWINDDKYINTTKSSK